MRRTSRLVRRADLLDAGWTSSRIGHQLARGRLHRVFPGVYSLEPPPLRPDALELAAVLACGAGTAVSHRSATVVLCLLPPREGPVHVTSPTHRRGVVGIRVHESAVEPVSHRGIPVTSPARTLLDLAATEPDELERALNEARILRLVTSASLDAQLTSGRRGVATLRAALTSGPGLHRSEAERRLIALVVKGRLPRHESNVRVGGYEVDLLFREARLVIEIDGYAFHSTRSAFERDRRKDADLLAAGYRVLRVTWRQIVEEPYATLATIARALGAS